jgi:hypothetical protein
MPNDKSAVYTTGVLWLTPREDLLCTAGGRKAYEGMASALGVGGGKGRVTGVYISVNIASALSVCTKLCEWRIFAHAWTACAE